MAEFLSALENSGFAAWLRESPSVWAYPTILTLHTVGLAVLVGANMAVDLRVLGFAPGIPIGALARAFPIMWAGFWLNAMSGLALFVGDASAMGTATIFIAKLGIIAAGVALIFVLRHALFGRGVEQARSTGVARLAAAASLAVWIAAIAAGRYMAYV